MNYIGSKLSLLGFIEETIKEVCGENLENKIFCDLFAGTGVVGAYFKNKCKKIISNDMEYYSFVLIKHFIENNNIVDFDFSVLNNIEKEGFIFKEYFLKNRMYFTEKNSKKIDGIREEIETYKNNESIYFFVLASFLESLDGIANTASVYGAYLKQYKESAKKNLIIKPIKTIIGLNKGIAYNKDANVLIKEIEGDILYIDPPYNSRQYASNYHMLNTIAEYKEFEPKGITGLPPSYNKSLFCRASNSFIVLEDLIKNANFKYIFLSYNDEGIIPLCKIKEIFSKYGKYSLKEVNYKRFKADNSRKNLKNSVIEYLHILEK